LLNEAAILAARRNLTEISMDEVNDAIDRVLAGPEKKDRVMSEKRKTLVAYHEAGHALVGALMPDYDPVQKISIIPAWTSRRFDLVHTERRPDGLRSLLAGLSAKSNGRCSGRTHCRRNHLW
jgi:ATP-dependent Zn protease